jgi:hypothetical protein
MEKRKIYYPCEQLNPDSSAVHPVHGETKLITGAHAVCGLFSIISGILSIAISLGQIQNIGAQC